MIDLSIKEMIEAGAHFGHQTKRWNPKMKSYIYGVRSGVHILDLGQTYILARNAFRQVEEIVSRGEMILFVGTKPQASEVIDAEAKRCQMPYVTRRWLGGMLTNFSTIKKSVDRLIDLERRRVENDFVGYTKKELLGVDREIEKLTVALGGIKEMKRLPGALFVVDPMIERIAVHEANILGIPVIAVVDSNCDPDCINYVIPANDDALRSIQIFASRIADAVLLGRQRGEANALHEGEARPKEKRAARRTKQIEGRGRAYVAKTDVGTTEESDEGGLSHAAPQSVSEDTYLHDSQENGLLSESSPPKN